MRRQVVSADGHNLQWTGGEDLGLAGGGDVRDELQRWEVWRTTPSSDGSTCRERFRSPSSGVVPCSRDNLSATFDHAFNTALHSTRLS
ncbi:unnamed protein product [Urochloa humidicola]